MRTPHKDEQDESEFWIEIESELAAFTLKNKTSEEDVSHKQGAKKTETR